MTGIVPNHFQSPYCVLVSSALRKDKPEHHCRQVLKGSSMESRAVFVINGEPAVVINGLPKAISGGMETIHGHNACGSRHANDPYFGEWLEGRKVKKLYKHQYHLGEVVKYDPQINCYMVVYEDGNSEDLQWDELKEVLLPLDINIPLKLLALQRCRHVKFFSDLKIASQMGKNNHVKSLMERTPDSFQFPVSKNPCKSLQNQEIVLSGSVEPTSFPSFEEFVQKPEENAVVVKDHRICARAKDGSDLFQKPSETKGLGSSENMNGNGNKQEKFLGSLRSLRRILRQTKMTRVGKPKMRKTISNQNQEN